MNDNAENRRGRLKALRDNADTDTDGAGEGTGAARRPRARRRARGGAGGQEGGFRSRILASLKNVQEGDTVIEGTEVGQKQLENFMDLLDKMESNGVGGKLKEKVTEALSPVETDEGFQFSQEGVTKLLELLERKPEKGEARGRAGGAKRRAGAGGGGGRMAGGRGQGLRGAGRGRGQGLRGAGAGRLAQRRGGEGGGGRIRDNIEELSKKVEELSKTVES